MKGVTPDLMLPDVLNYSTDIGEGALENPLPWDSIRGVDFNKFNLVQPYLSDLRLRSEARTATNQAPKRDCSISLVTNSAAATSARMNQ